MSSSVKAIQSVISKLQQLTFNEKLQLENRSKKFKDNNPKNECIVANLMKNVFMKFKNKSVTIF